MSKPEPGKCGTGVILLIDPVSRKLIAVPTLCHRWDCPTCGPARLRKVRAQAVAGKPERMITLTTRPADGLSLLQAVRWFRVSWRTLLRRLRDHFPRIEYMAFVELHKSGWPHMHILTRGCYVPQRMLKTWWADITGSFIVHIQKIDRTWAGINEATKYCLKTAREVHAAAPRLPVYTMSHGWLPADWHEGDRPPGDYLFYAYCPLSWADFEDLISTLGGSLLETPKQPGRFTVEMRGPPDPHGVELAYDLGGYGEVEAVSAICTFYAARAADFDFVEELMDRQDFAADPKELT